MARIRMKNTSKESVQEVFLLFLSASAGKGVKNKTIDTFKQHFHAISKRRNVEVPLSSLTEADLNAMIRQMREDGLADTSINSYTRTLKVFLSWCNEQGRTELNLPIYKAAEAVKETYSDEELLLLLKKPEAGCGFCEFRNWTIINFLLNSGCRASTVRAIQNQDVDLVRRQILFRHTKNGKIQMIIFIML